MRATLIPAHQLTGSQIRAWSEIERCDAALDSPFFCPEFTLAVASVRRDVEVAMWQEGSQVIAVLPFQRAGWGRGLPAGACFSEFHGLIGGAERRGSVARLLTDCRLASWSYDHLPLTQTCFEQYHQQVFAAPFMDLSGGFEAYCRRKRQNGSSVIGQARRKARKLAREVGPLRFELHNPADGALQLLFRWKSEQHRRTRVVDVFQFSWVRRFLRAVRDTQTERFQGLLSVLWAADRPAAVHLGICTDKVAHLWYPAYDPQLARYSPGITLLVEWARELGRRGIQRIDLGPGPQCYKQRFQTGSMPVAVGTADRFQSARLLRRGWTRAKAGIGRSGLGEPARAAARAMFRARRRRALRMEETSCASTDRPAQEARPQVPGRCVNPSEVPSKFV